MHKKALTLLEILISTLILAITIAGLANLYISGQKWLLHARSRMTGVELGKYFLEPLQMDVRQDTWNTNCLGAGNCPNQTISISEGPNVSRNYTASYNVSLNSPIANLTKVKVNITWPRAE